MKTRFIFSEVIGRLKNSLKIKEDKEIADRLNMKAGTFNARKKSQSLPFEEILELAELEKIDYNWLLTGEGDTYKRTGLKLVSVTDENGVVNVTNESIAEVKFGASESFSDEDLQILRMIKRLPPNKKKDEVEAIEGFLQRFEEDVRHWVAVNGTGTGNFRRRSDDSIAG